MKLYVLFYKHKSEWRFVEGGGSSTPASPKVYKTKQLAEKYKRIYAKSYGTYVHIAELDIQLPN